MTLTIWNITLVIVLTLSDFSQPSEGQLDQGSKLSTIKQKSTRIQSYTHIPKFSKYKSQGELRECNSTFYLLPYSVYNPEKECEKHSSMVLGLEELMIFIYEVR